ncbi:MAG: N-acetylmuramoyl-L-alanine amidase [Chloroflexi bacterium]|nr:N-acetylmuramoyl-L-alanine amidase [Chloroflexota bacterium]
MRRHSGEQQIARPGSTTPASGPDRGDVRPEQADARQEPRQGRSARVSRCGTDRRRFLQAWALVVAGTIGLPGAARTAAAAEADPPTDPSRPVPGQVPTLRSLFAPSAPSVILPPASARPPATGGNGMPAWIHSREAWNAASPAQPYVQQTPKGVSLHHTGAPWNGKPAVEQYLRNIQAFHTGPEREWEDIAYHYLVDLDGGIWAGRPPTVRGNPSIYYDPTGLVLICFIGDFSLREATETQLAGAADTAAWLMKRFDISPTALTGHRDHAPTSCPGDNLYRVLKDGSFPRMVQERLSRMV